MKPTKTTGSRLSIDKKGHRDSISRFIKSQAGNIRGKVLDVGCGNMPYRELILSSNTKVMEYLGLDLESNYIDRKIIPDLTWDGVRIPLPDQSVDFALATEVLEHCPDTKLIVSEIHRVLRPNGTLLFTVPFLWPLHEVPYDYFRLTPFTLRNILSETGFRHIDVKMLGGWDASLAQMLGLWVVRRPGMNRFLRKLLKLIFKPIIWMLRKIDARPAEFVEGQMITGIGGVAGK
ncbi:MAG: class I SAM-dependent methyltransferase [Tenericutes bacterium]|nr:MAG: class I SAM-dependent methyltransferase [Mycoplasmatota bacterium]